MSRLSLLLLAAALALGSSARADDPGAASTTPADPADAAAPAVSTAPLKLVFTYPCTFAYSSGKPYETRVMDYQCDYLHASVAGGRAQFNALPTLAAQRAMLSDVIERADGAHDKYMKDVTHVLDKTDPAKLPAKLTPAQQMTRLKALQEQLGRGVLDAAGPFLWPKREEPTYVARTPGWWPPSWKPYIQPVYARSSEIDARLKTLEQGMAKSVNARVEKRLDALGKLKTGAPQLDRAFDGGLAHGAAVPAEVPKAPPPVPPALPSPRELLLTQPKKLLLDPGQGVPAPDVAPAPAKPRQPLATEGQDWERRDYFARGVKQGSERLREEAEVFVWHALGRTRTVGDPQEDLPFIVHQQGPSCGVGAQYEALRARGRDVNIAQLAVDARDKGYYVDYETSSGHRVGGTPDDNLNSELRDHGVESRVLRDATDSDLLASIRSGGGAVVATHARQLWQDPTIGENERHAVYVTGAEVDKAGTLRGVYINDTGTGEGARFVPIDVFHQAWDKIMVTFVPSPKPVPTVHAPASLPPGGAPQGSGAAQ